MEKGEYREKEKEREKARGGCSSIRAFSDLAVTRDDILGDCDSIF